ncbi:uncharacterized protein K489DRAFT_416370 [Dissoconium aciculare CBS 342.82]|uniref:Uncharacterized protein n=1 Tax=Dissoconium aciculare CBS 342.82 TaxID=1314786 RepID=A0A6J3LW92_9PEZI|nr:uncharacterized protein K489DRAFT_416370 [Dissoconium aciculare CBS 342.82]KAF1820040.1 hypothetical protein K489DRAFT_416370 [Dissoconium aciculare CBS 342.82]
MLLLLLPLASEVCYCTSPGIAASCGIRSATKRCNWFRKTLWATEVRKPPPSECQDDLNRIDSDVDRWNHGLYGDDGVLEAEVDTRAVEDLVTDRLRRCGIGLERSNGANTGGAENGRRQVEGSGLNRRSVTATARDGDEDYGDEHGMLLMANQVAEVPRTS